MSSLDHNRRYLKRKASLAKRPASPDRGVVKSYSGERYRQDKWVPLMSETELAVYETIRLTNRQLSNDVVRVAFTKLVQRLNNGVSPDLTPADQQPEFVPGRETEFLIWNIRRRWTRFFDEKGEVNVTDLVGLLRTLLYSIKAHQWSSGRQFGYVAFIQDFLERGGLDSEAEVDELRAGLNLASSPHQAASSIAESEKLETGSDWTNAWKKTAGSE